MTNFENPTGQRYKVPKEFASMTVTHSVLDEILGETRVYESVAEYFAEPEHEYALLADLTNVGINIESIEKAVNEGVLSAAHWPEKAPVTDLLWPETEKSKDALSKLGAKAVEFCYGNDMNKPIGGNFISVGAEMLSQQLAIVGLIYARHNGLLREIPYGDPSDGPLYVVRDSMIGEMVNNMLPQTD